MNSVGGYVLCESPCATPVGEYSEFNQLWRHWQGI